MRIFPRRDLGLMLFPLALACGGGTGAQASPDASPDAKITARPDSGTPADAADAACKSAGAESWDPTIARVDGTDIAVNGPPQIGVDGAGNTFAVWEQQPSAGGLHFTVWASVRSANGSWSAATQIDGTAATGIPAEPVPALAVSASGTAVVVYQTASGPDTNVTYVFYTPGAGWGAPVAFFPPVSANNTSGNESPQVAIDSKGNAVAAWTQDMGDQDSSKADFDLELYAARAPAGQPFGAPVLLSNYVVTGVAASAHVALDEQGNALVVSQASPGNAPIGVIAALSSGGGSWSTAAFLDGRPVDSNLGILPRAALDGKGNALVAWAQKSSTTSVPAFAARYSGGAWSAPAQLDTTLGTNLLASDVRVAFDAGGNGVAVWTNTSNDATHPNSIFAARNVGGSWGAATPIDTTKPGSNARPELATDAAGDVMVVWDNQSNVWAALATGPSGAFTPEVEVDPATSSAGRPVAAFLPGCPDAVVLYQDSAPGGAGNNNGIYSQVFR